MAATTVTATKNGKVKKSVRKTAVDAENRKKENYILLRGEVRRCVGIQTLFTDRKFL